MHHDDMTTTDQPLPFTDTHRADELEQPSLLDALAVLAVAAACCSSRTTEHDALCPVNPDPAVCDACSTVYDPAVVDTHPDCPGGHCADEACACGACTYLPRPTLDACSL